MSNAPGSRRVASAAAVSLLALALLACSGATQTPASGASVAPSGSAAAGSADPGPAIDTDTLLGAAGDRDGQPVRVRGFFLAADDKAQLCSAALESYPPQCGGATVRVTGEASADVIAALESTREPGLAQATWGWVVVEGTFRASGADGQPTIELGSIVLAEG